MENKEQDMKILGTGVIKGGSYRQVTIAGAGSVDGDLLCEAMNVTGGATVKGSVEAGTGVTIAGVATIQGNLTAKTNMNISGGATIEGNASANLVRISGNGNIFGNLEASDIHISGSGTVKGNMTAAGETKVSGRAQIGGLFKSESAKCSGSLKVGGGVECESLTISGHFEIEGLLNAGNLQICPAGDCTATEIGGETVRISRAPEYTINIFNVKIQINKPNGQVKAESIEANQIHLEDTTADIVRGHDVEIGAKCTIKRLEYSGTCTVSEEATVEETIRID